MVTKFLILLALLLISTTQMQSQAQGQSRVQTPTNTAPVNTRAATNAAQNQSVDQKLVVVIERTALTDQVVQYVMYALELMPAGMKQEFVNFGTTVVVTPTHNRINGEPGHAEYEPPFKRVVVCERNTDGRPIQLQRTPITTLHELGHAYDHMRGYPSRTDAFKVVYDEEAAKVYGEDRVRLQYFLQPGRLGTRECFASLFACRFLRTPDLRLDTLKKDFPKTYALVQSY